MAVVNGDAAGDVAVILDHADVVDGPGELAARDCFDTCVRHCHIARMPLTDVDRAEVVRLVRAGEHTIPMLATLFGVNRDSITRAIDAAGIERPSASDAMRTRWAVANAAHAKRDAEILRRYHEGESVLAISKAVGTSRGPVLRVLNEAGIQQRGFSDAQVERHKRLTEADRKAMTRAANATVRGTKQEESVVELRSAKSAGKFLSKLEALFFSALDQAGIAPKPNYQVGRYLIDLAYPEQMLAVEVDGGNWHDSPKKREQDRVKTAFLEARGWRVVRLKERDLAGCVDKIQAGLQMPGAAPQPTAE